jgi:hypothetical protein
MARRIKTRQAKPYKLADAEDPVKQGRGAHPAVEILQPAATAAKSGKEVHAISCRLCSAVVAHNVDRHQSNAVNLSHGRSSYANVLDRGLARS